MFKRKKSTELFGFNVRLTPPTMAESQAPERIDWTAQSIARREDEHAVSIV